MKNKFYLIEYSSMNEWEVSKGMCIICEESRRSVVKKFAERVKDRKIKSITLINYKQGIIFNQDVSIL